MLACYAILSPILGSFSWSMDEVRSTSMLFSPFLGRMVRFSSIDGCIARKWLDEGRMSGKVVACLGRFD